METSMKVMIGAGAGAVTCIALAAYLRKKKLEEAGTACDIAGACASVVAVGAAVYGIKNQKDELTDGKETSLSTATPMLFHMGKNIGGASLHASLKDTEYEPDARIGEHEETPSEKADKLVVRYKLMAVGARARGFSMAADCMEHFLGGTGNIKNFDSKLLKDIEEVQKAVAKNISRYDDEFKKYARKINPGNKLHLREFPSSPDTACGPFGLQGYARRDGKVRHGFVLRIGNIHRHHFL